MQAEDFVREVRNTQFEFLSPQLAQLVTYKEEIFPNYRRERGSKCGVPFGGPEKIA